MLRTNLSFLSFIESLYQKQERKEDIRLKNFPKDSFLLQQGEKVFSLLMIKEGITKCYLSEENGKNYIVEFLSKGEIAGEIEVIRNVDCLCTMKAVTDVQAYLIAVPFFRSLLNENLVLNKLLINELAERVINTSSRASFQQLHTIEHGLAKLLELQSKQNITITKEDMAAYLGVTIRSLNRSLKALK